MLLDGGVERRVPEQSIALESANRQLEADVAALAHDLRFALRAIQGVTHVLTQSYTDPSTVGARECIDCIRLNIDQMSRIIDDLKRLSGSGLGGTFPAVTGSAAASGKIEKPG